MTIGTSLLLIAAGAILQDAVTVGLILMIVRLVGLAIRPFVLTRARPTAMSPVPDAL